MLKIGTLKLKSNLILAPMAGITDFPFRMLNRKFGCELAFIEMLNVRSISYRGKKTRQMLSFVAQDRPLGIQLLGSEPKFILMALDILRQYKFDILDFNAACPARKVVRRGEGASLLKEPKELRELLKILVKNSSVPVTVKIRAGWDQDSVNAEEVSLMAQDAGISGLFIHGRTKMQEYSGQVDYRIIRKVKKALGIPVVASGDIFSAQLAKKMFEETDCDAVAIARGALGNPWIFREVKELLKNKKALERPGLKEIVSIMTEHLQENIDFYGERIGALRFRKFFNWYTKGLHKVRPLRQMACSAKNKEQMLGVFARMEDEKD